MSREGLVSSGRSKEAMDKGAIEGQRRAVLLPLYQVVMKGDVIRKQHVLALRGTEGPQC